MDVTNKTNRPLAIPLPRGKTMHLGPRKKGQIAANAVDHPPVRKLVDAGEIEITDERSRPEESGSAGASGGAPLPAHGPSGAGRRSSGDR